MKWEKLLNESRRKDKHEGGHEEKEPGGTKGTVKVVLIKPGPTDTPMTAHLKQSGAKLAAVDRVAREIVRGTENGCRVVYAPKIWSVIMMMIRHLPHFVFRRMGI